MKPPKCNKRTSGIYQIRNTITNGRYIGSSINLYGRWSVHKSQLTRNKHPNRHLQFSWNKHGAENFIFEIVKENIENSDLTANEQQYLDKCILQNISTYNLGLIVDAPMRGGKHTEKTKIKISKASKGTNNPMYGKKHTKENRKRMSEIQKNFGDTMSTEGKIAVSKFMRQRQLNHNSNAKLTFKKAQEIRMMSKKGESLKEIAKRFNISISTIGDINKFRTWKPEDHER